MPHPSTQAWAPTRPALSIGPSTLLFLLTLAPSSLCLSPEKERWALPGKESLGLRGSQAGEPWTPRAGDSQQKTSPDLGSKELRFPDQQGRRGPRHTCGQKEFSPGSESQQHVFGSGTSLTILSQPKVTPTIHVFAPSQDELATNKATLVCLMSGFYPRTVEVAWTKDGSPVSQGVETTPSSRQSDKYSASSYLSVSADQWLSANTFTCKVTHDGKVIQKELSQSQCT
ncbi:LOW QUALITY PROTEIN: immunoglobulin lambda-like polypeptide 1 [Phascolarctos cinereus]|uniref:LOW QUALITY PROTEIN: immunoglobulin lambda-like polypeptide 1 n=1 Tax=Phascolarctos cinereus TaxID=38626 RepID=UPI000A280758|nr:LOW QUALITY PROTEIN: immunoglobulin lambda-like polypeptide 1 [Phascolarctos cinereus]